MLSSGSGAVVLGMKSSSSAKALIQSIDPRMQHRNNAVIILLKFIFSITMPYIFNDAGHL